MVLHNPNNWHWVNKDARDWAQSYFSKKLVGISAEDGSVSVKIDSVANMEGDVDVSQRKGKIITLFDVKLKLEYSGKNGEDEGSGSITIPEVAHDTEIDEYVFEISNYSDSKEKQPIRDLVRTKITPQIREALSKFGGDLIEENGKDIQHKPGSGPVAYTNPHGDVAASSSKAAATPKSASKPTETIHTTGHVVNTVTVTETYEFNTSADQLYQTFTDPQRVTAFTRAPPRVFEPKEGGKFELFGGNVQGTFISLEKDKKIVQSWRLADWPKDHYSTLNIIFDQGTDSTNLRLTWEGVPVGQDEVAKKNFGEYYVRSIKTTFGYDGSPSDFPRYITVSSGSWWDMGVWSEVLVVLGLVVAVIAWWKS